MRADPGWRLNRGQRGWSKGLVNAPAGQHPPSQARSTHLVDQLLHQRVLPGVALDQHIPRVCQDDPRLAVPLQQGFQILAVQLKPGGDRRGGC